MKLLYYNLTKLKHKFYKFLKSLPLFYDYALQNLKKILQRFSNKNKLLYNNFFEKYFTLKKIKSFYTIAYNQFAY